MLLTFHSGKIITPFSRHFYDVIPTGMLDSFTHYGTGNPKLSELCENGASNFLEKNKKKTVWRQCSFRTTRSRVVPQKTFLYQKWSICDELWQENIKCVLDHHVKLVATTHVIGISCSSCMQQHSLGVILFFLHLLQWW